MSVIWHADVVIIGSGLAGLSAAWHLRDQRVMVLSPSEEGGSSYLARGGIAAAIGNNDSVEAHVADTVRAGAGLVDRDVAEVLVREGMERMIDLFEMAIPFDRDAEGRLMLGREALHGRNRIVHAAGDDTGRQVTRAVREALMQDEARAPRFLPGRALELVVDEGRVCGVVFENAGQVGVVLAKGVLLATGGVGGLYQHTTNGPGALGEGMALAARVGARLADLEFVQFHPTALLAYVRPLPLLSEAIRGQGAMLVDGEGRAIMAGHPQGDLAGRDVVARALWARVGAGEAVFLDARAVPGFETQFPRAAEALGRLGLDAAQDLLPVTPAAHYHMGGVATDAKGRTNVPGLWAAGEVASTGVHGANRLASNSLLETMVFGARAAWDIGASTSALQTVSMTRIRELERAWSRGIEAAVDPGDVLERVGRTMWQFVGIERSEAGLIYAAQKLDGLRCEVGVYDPARLAIEAAQAIARAAHRRRETRGAHCRVDFPDRDPTLARRLFVQGGLASRVDEHPAVGATR
ncbi:L-aspartate oxidase [Lujinxingia vulgaris]|nr:L-aspartate oxidase [Lujinxingia vulgaris]